MALILAAGASTRMGKPKALVKSGGTTLLRQVSDPYEHIDIPVVVITGFHANKVEPFLKDLCLDFVRNPAPWRGMISSVRTGLHAVPRTVDHVFIHPVDCPGVTPDTLQILMASLRAFPAAGGAKPTFRQRGGHPLLLAKPTWLRVLSRRYTDLRSAVAGSSDYMLRIELDDAAVLNDFDTPASLEAH